MGSNNRHSNRRRRTAAAVLTAALALAACGGDDDDAGSAGDEPVEDLGGEATAEMSAAGGDAALESDDSGAAASADRDGGFDLGAIGRDVIIEMRVVVSSDDIERTVASVTAAASTLGGGIASSDVNYGNADENDGFAVLVVKVPPEAVDRFLGGLDDTGTVQSINQSARDVTEQLVDLDVRISNARQSVASVREFMERTENLNELVSLEAELTRRQTELERLEAQQRNLSDRVALSTITIEVVPTAAVPEPAIEEERGIGDAFESGWKAFVAVLFGLAFVVAATLPFLVTGLIVAAIAWFVVRRRDRRPEAARAGAPPPGPDPDPSEDDREPELVG